MGLAATQTRFLSLTARKSNVEYQGQQINQQRTVLSNKSANLYSEMLTLSVPVPPSKGDFSHVVYYFQPADTYVKYQATNVNTNKETGIGTADFVKPGSTEKVYEGVAITIKNETGTYTATIDGKEVRLSVGEEIDEAGYEVAYNQYVYKQYLYEQEMEAINAKTEIIQQQDKALELQLSQLDTEQNEIKTEMEALDTVLGDNVESSYKTFGG